MDVFFLNQRLFLANVWFSKTKMAEDVKTGLMGNTKMALSISYRVMYVPNFWHCVSSGHSCLRKQEIWETQYG